MPEIDKNNVLHILGEKVAPGEGKKINLITANLYTNTEVKVPVFIERSHKKGPVVLVTGGIHGDEFNGVEDIRQFISRGINIPERGTIITIPIINTLGFLHQSRYFPDGRDLNRCFPGFEKGSLASRFAYQFTTEILPLANLCMDFHTGGAKRFNAAQIRVTKGDDKAREFALAFNAPFTMYSNLLPDSYRETCFKKNIPYIIYEGGMSEDNNKEIACIAVDGIMRVLKHLNMLKSTFEITPKEEETIFIKNASWIRAENSGLLHNKIKIGSLVKKGDRIATVTDPYGSFKNQVYAPNDGYIINVNRAPLVFEGDAIYHISTELGE